MPEDYVGEQNVAMVCEADRPHDLEQYFDLLASFCVHDGIAIEALQNEIFKHTKDLVPKPIPVKFVKGVAQVVTVEHRVFANTPGVHYADWNIVHVPLEDYPHPKFLTAALHTMCQVSVGYVRHYPTGID